MNVQELLTKWGFQVDHKPLEHLEHRLEQIKERLEFLSAVEVVKGIFELTEKFSHFAESLGTSATSAGLTVEELQRLQFAAGQAGVGAEEVSGSMARLTRTLYEARKGSAQAKETFAAAGITEDQIAGFHTGADAMAALADRMKGMSDPIEKQALAMQLLGRGSHNMVEFLSEGSESMRKLGASADRMGAVVSTRDIKALRDMEDAMSALGQMIRAISAHLASMFAPAVKEAVGQLQKFYAANRDIIESRLKDWALNTIYALGFVAGVVRGLAKDFFEFARGHQELFATLGKFALGYTVISGISKLASAFGPAIRLIGAGIDIGSTVIGKLASALTSIVTKGAVLVADTLPALRSGFAALSTFLGLGPLGTTLALVAAIAGLVLIGEAAYTMLFKGGNFKDTWLGQLWAGAKGKAKWLAEKLNLHWFDEEAPEEKERRETMKGYMSQSVFGSDERYDKGIGRIQTVEEGLKAASSAANMAPPAQFAPPASPGAGAASDPSGRLMPASQTFNVNLVVPPLAPGQDPKTWGREVGAGLVEGVQNQTELKRTKAVTGTAGQDF